MYDRTVIPPNPTFLPNATMFLIGTRVSSKASLKKQREKKRIIEIERMKATLVALTKKLNLVNDVRDANQADREALAESETRRNELQNQCEMMGNKFEEELTRNKEKQDEYLDEIHELREQVQTLK